MKLIHHDRGGRAPGFTTFLPYPKRHLIRAILLLFLAMIPATGVAQIRRVVIVKSDGLSHDVVDRFVKLRDPRSGKSELPWIEHIFYQRGSRLENFYVRGMSLSAPSWSLLETGQHLVIKGNVEFDRYTLHSYDYLNFLPFIVKTAVGTGVDMPAVEVLDSLGLPMMADAYSHNERYATFSLFQRGPRFITFQRGMLNRFRRTPKELLDEWAMGFELRNVVTDQLIKELLDKIADPKVRYLDIVLQDFDHIAHHNNDAQSQLFVLRQIDSILGQCWTAIKESSLADETALIVVSDHGFNSDEHLYSQGYNLVKLLGSTSGGGHHVITKRRLLLDYSIKGVNPFVPLITTTTQDSYYLREQSDNYPTALLDFDGNERASIHLRDSDLNLLHLLLRQLKRNDLSEKVRAAATEAFFETIEKRRAEWHKHFEEISKELEALRRSITKQDQLWALQPRKFTREELEVGRDDEVKRIYAQLVRWQKQEKEYSDYARTLGNLLALKRDLFSPNNIRIEDVIQRRSMGDRNSIYQLQHYIVGLSRDGLTLGSDGALDLEKSFTRVDYFSLLHGIAVRNNVQPGVSNRPIDIIATRIPVQLIAPLINDPTLARDVVWVYGGPERQALILAREDSRGGLSFRYQPIENLEQDAAGHLHFKLAAWASGFPLHIIEDENLQIPEGDPARWLSEWHRDVEWLKALHRTEYSNGLIGLHEELALHVPEDADNKPGMSSDSLLMRRLVRRQRDLIEADMLVVASNHWNFDVRGFNPGGNHGSFFRISTHSTLMVAGGARTGIPRALAVEEPYDSLSFVPTVLALTGNLRDDSTPIPVLWDKGFRRFPGRVIKELLPLASTNPDIAITGASTPP